MKTAGIIGITATATIVVEIILGVLLAKSGLYNVSVLSPDPGPIHWLFSTTSRNSVIHHSAGIHPPNLADSALAVEGFHHYNEMCVTCHGAPGIERSEAGEGLYPHPPDLVHSAKHMPAREMFWIVKNGIKSTGMPSFGKTHSDQKIWAIVAFLEKMKNMTPAEYASMQKAAKSGEGNQTMQKTNINMHKH